jgi:hypothetical protein
MKALLKEAGFWFPYGFYNVILEILNAAHWAAFLFKGLDGA